MGLGLGFVIWDMVRNKDKWRFWLWRFLAGRWLWQPLAMAEADRSLTKFGLVPLRTMTSNNKVI